MSNDMTQEEFASLLEYEEPKKFEKKEWKHGYCSGCGVELTPTLDPKKDICARCDRK